MKVKITAIRKADSQVRVTFSTAIGTGEATWKNGMPEVGEEQEVELDINEAFVYGKNAKASNEFYSLSMKKNMIILNAKLISITDEGVAVIDMKGTTATIELAGYPSTPPTFINLSLKSLNLYPVYL